CRLRRHRGRDRRCSPVGRPEQRHRRASGRTLVPWGWDCRVLAGGRPQHVGQSADARRVCDLHEEVGPGPLRQVLRALVLAGLGICRALGHGSVCPVRRSYLPPLLLLSAIWGSSYMFIKVGVRDFSPAALVELRLLLAASVLVSFVAAGRGLRAVGRALAPGAVVGVVGMALPFLLISWG